MSERLRVCLVGATGLIGGKVVELSAGSRDLNLVALARRDASEAAGPNVDIRIARPEAWPQLIAQTGAQVFVCALGTTWRKSGKSEAAFRAVDFDLVLDCARAAREAGVTRMIAVSSVGADPTSSQFYLRVKGETDEALASLGFDRLDILRPGLLIGPRSGDRRLGERIGILLSPLANLLFHGRNRRFRSIGAGTVASAIFSLARETGAGHFVHENDAIRRAASGSGDKSERI